MRDSLDSRFYYRAVDFDRASTSDQEYIVLNVQGTMICARESFVRVDGYDEVFRGWGGEDYDLYERLSLVGVQQRSYPIGFVMPIEHDDTERTTFSEVKSKKANMMVNQMYRSAKKQLMALAGFQPSLPMNQRLALYSKIRKVVIDWESGLHPDLPHVSFTFKANVGLGTHNPYVFSQQITINSAILQKKTQ